MKCDNCEIASICEDPAHEGGGCDMDGVDDFGCGTDEFDREEEARADYEELCADIDRDESEDRKGGVPLFDVAVAQLEREGW